MAEFLDISADSSKFNFEDHDVTDDERTDDEEGIGGILPVIHRPVKRSLDKRKKYSKIDTSDESLSEPEIGDSSQDTESDNDESDAGQGSLTPLPSLAPEHSDAESESSSHQQPMEEQRDQEDSSNNEEEVDIEQIANSFLKKIKKCGISQRQAAKLILNCSQSTLSEAISKAKRIKSSKKISPRGMFIYKDMKEWLNSKEEQRNAIQKNAQQKVRKPKRQHIGSGKKGTRFSFVQLCVLVELYKKDSRPSGNRKQLISETLGLEFNQVNTWFNNQRSRNFVAAQQVEKLKKKMAGNQRYHKHGDRYYHNNS